MATVIYQPGASDLNVLLSGIGMIQDFVTSRNYKNRINDLLSGRREGRETVTEQAPYEMNLPTEFQPVEGFTETGYYQGMQPTNFQPSQTTVPITRQRTPEELTTYDIQTRRMVDALAAGVPQQYRIDTRSLTMQPGDELGLEEQLRLRQKYRAGKTVKPYVSNEPKPRLYNYNDPADFAAAQRAIEKGYTLEAAPRDSLTQMLRLIKENKYTGDPYTIRALEQQVEEKTLSPEERQSKQLEPIMKYLDNLRIGKSNEQKQVIEQYRERARKASPKEYGTIIQDAFNATKKKAGKLATDAVIQRYIIKYGKDKALERLKKDGYE